MPPDYLFTAVNRSDGPEDRGLGERCLGAGLPNFNGFQRIVQSPASVSMFYDIGQGQGRMRVIPITTAPHVPSSIRQWWGDSRGRWEGDTLVVDVTNFNAKRNFQGSRQNLHLIERWTRINAGTLEYVVTIDGSNHVDQAVDGQGRTTETERPGKSNLLRTSMPRGELRYAYNVAGGADGR